MDQARFVVQEPGNLYLEHGICVHLNLAPNGAAIDSLKACELLFIVEVSTQ